ncbi:MAG: hypothetical protein AAFQ05_02135 [Pseudomonadota bacterium]
METTEKIVEAYVRYVKGWATIPNLRCDGQFEIDLIAIDPVTFERYHIETTVSGSQSYSKLTAKEFSVEKHKQRVQKAGQRRTVGFFVERKFGQPQIAAKLSEYGFTDENSHKVVVTWDWTPEAEDAATAAGIEFWSFQSIMAEIANSIRHQRAYFTDDTLRTINLFVRAMQGLQRDDAKPDSAPPKAETGEYWVYRNWVHKRARLHRPSCSYCNFGKGTQGVETRSTGEWRPFPDIEAARTYLNGLGYDDAANCGVCM